MFRPDRLFFNSLILLQILNKRGQPPLTNAHALNHDGCVLKSLKISNQNQ